jgi:hypothetical protein
VKSLVYRHWLKLVVALGILGMLALAFDYFFPTTGIGSWCGSCDLEITFLVTDAESGQPLPGAVLDIAETRSGTYDITHSFKLVTDGNGIVKLFCKDCFCCGTFGSRYGKRINTFGVRAPYQMFHVSAEGYERGRQKY